MKTSTLGLLGLAGGAAYGAGEQLAAEARLQAQEQEDQRCVAAGQPIPPLPPPPRPTPHRRRPALVTFAAAIAGCALGLGLLFALLVGCATASLGGTPSSDTGSNPIVGALFGIVTGGFIGALLGVVVGYFAWLRDVREGQRQARAARTYAWWEQRERHRQQLAREARPEPGRPAWN